MTMWKFSDLTSVKGFHNLSLEMFCMLLNLFRKSLSFSRFEDGTLPYLEILAVKHGFDSFKELIGTSLNLCCKSI